MTPDAIRDLVVVTGPVSAALFVFALFAAALLRIGPKSRAVPFWWAFVAIHTIHFSAVAWLAFVSAGANLRDIGGWPAALGVGAGFYTLAVCAGLAWSGTGPRAVRGIGHASVTLIALAFIATYVPLVAISAGFALPVAAIVAALGLYLARVVRCIPRALA